MEKRLTIKERAAMIRQVVQEMYPNAHCELVHHNELELLIAIALSAQTTDEAVNKATKGLFQRFPSLNDYIEASIEEIIEEIKHLGLYRNKAKNLKAMAEKIHTDYQGQVPNNQHDLEALPGVGRKTANVFLAVWHHIPRIAVDTHVERVSKRLGLVRETDSVIQVEETLMKRFAKSDWIDLHHQLLFFGRYFCKAKNPPCHECPLYSICRKPQT